MWTIFEVPLPLRQVEFASITKLDFLSTATVDTGKAVRQYVPLVLRFFEGFVALIASGVVSLRLACRYGALLVFPIPRPWVLARH